MLKIILFLLIAFSLPITAYPEQWSETTGSPTLLLKATVNKPGTEVSISWYQNVVPGDDLLNIINKTEIGTFYERYKFIGVSGGAAIIDITGASMLGSATEAKNDGSLNQRLYFTSNGNGTFPIIPTSLKGLGWFELIENNTHPGMYRLLLHKDSN